MRNYLQVFTIIILNFTADCGARVHEIYESTGNNTHFSSKELRNKTIKWRKDNELIALVENQKPSTRQPEKFHMRDYDNSLFILNLTVNDSGIYQAQSGQWEKEEIRFKLTVQDPVSQPVINTNLVLQSNSSSVGHILVKCSADGESVTYDCDHKHCTRTNATSTKVNFTVTYTDNEMLECTASNHVSKKYTLIPMNNTGSKEPKVATKPNDYFLVIVIMSTLCFFLVLAVLLMFFLKHFYYNRKKKQNDVRNQEDKGINTVYSVVRKQPKTETSAYSGAAQNAAAAIYDVPSKCVRAPQIDSGDSVRNDDTHTVYWKLGQTQP